MTNRFHPDNFFAINEARTAAFFEDIEVVWNALAHLAAKVRRLTAGRQTILGEVMPGAYLSDRPIYIGEGARIEPGAYILGPAYVGEGAVVRHGALVRENVALLEGAILGHASEAKNSLLLPGAHAAHFNYVGDSILGHRVNLGAGSKLSNLTIHSRRDPDTGRRPTLSFNFDGEVIDTGLAKLGAILGDDVQTGCNAVLNPGCFIGPRTLVYANLSLLKGYYREDSIVKLRQELESAARR